ncbi:FliM/FliN family flagellar motor switch protein [Ochrobactrum sp. Marseille-Q0166]|uniref:FliM/FliN family flagellar motor switch protein n=1 Tax=Ochrobactrum sp. Marseille-Q0166 TaxID=2761105 RepID=UPI001655C9DC|nr:FliM/FliN family flagellar motor switch protein [Ochrobactrum sp. Marseille-Q0166]MBC8719596.1 FliM/FliN family flagellar motor switch protein [Ochrobactrum sp. Marseille-Q0166]
MNDLLSMTPVCNAGVQILDFFSRYYWKYTINQSLLPGPEVQISIETTHEAKFTTRDAMIFALIVGVPVLVHISGNITDALSDALIPAWREQSSAALPEHWRIVLTITRFCEIVFPNMAIEKLQLRSAPLVRSFSTSTDCVCAEIGVGKHEGRIAVICDFVALASQQIDFSALLRLRRSAPLPPCRMDIGFLPTRFTNAEFSALAVGDVVIIGEIVNGDMPVTGKIFGFGKFHLLIASSGGAKIKELQVNMENEEQIAMSSLIEHETAGSMHQMAQNQQAELADTFAMLPVTLEVRLATIAVSLEHLRDLGPGAALKHSFDLSDPVIIFANGVRFGTGKLIRMDDMVGVQISQWPVQAVG